MISPLATMTWDEYQAVTASLKSEGMAYGQADEGRTAKRAESLLAELRKGNRS